MGCKLRVLQSRGRLARIINQSGSQCKSWDPTGVKKMEFKSDIISEMIFDINDVIKVLKRLEVTEEMLSDYPSDSIIDTPETVFDLPKDFEGTQFTIGDCLESIKDHLYGNQSIRRNKQ